MRDGMSAERCIDAVPSDALEASGQCKAPGGPRRTNRRETRGILSVMAEQLDLTIVYESSEEGWIVASIPEVAGVFSQGQTREEARANVIDALRLMLSPEPSGADDQREREALHLTIAA